MTVINIELKNFSDIPKFVQLASKCNGEITVYSDTNRVNGKSILGLYSLDISKPLRVEFEGNIPDDVKEGITRFKVE